jgi:P2 family phage contractile tail tube protein
MAIQMPKVLKAFNVFVEGVGYAGRAKKFKLPELGSKLEEHRGAGMDFARQMDVGMENLEASLTMAEFSPEILKLVSIYNGSNTQVTLRGAYNDDSSPEATPMECKMRGAFHKVAIREHESGTPGEDEYTINLKFIQLTAAGEELYSIDNDNMIRRIGGVDQLESQRAAIGL